MTFWNVDKIRNLAEDAYNQAKPKSDVEARVYEVLSHKNWGSATSLMNGIAKDTYDYDKCECVVFFWVSNVFGRSVDGSGPMPPAPSRPATPLRPRFTF